MENEATTKTPIPTRSGFHNSAFCTSLHPDPLGLTFAFSIRRRSTLVETPLQIAPFYAKQTQFQNGQYKHKYGKNKGLCQRTTNNEQRTLFKTNPIKPNSPAPAQIPIPIFRPKITTPRASPPAEPPPPQRGQSPLSSIFVFR